MIPGKKSIRDVRVANIIQQSGLWLIAACMVFLLSTQSAVAQVIFVDQSSGLLSNEYNSFTSKDRYGQILIGSLYGFTVLDGHRSEVFSFAIEDSLKNEILQSGLIQGQDDQYWFSTYSDLVSFDIRNSKFRLHDVDIPDRSTLHLFHLDTINSELFVSSSSGIHRIDVSTLEVTTDFSSVISRRFSSVVANSSIRSYYGSPVIGASGYEKFILNRENEEANQYRSITDIPSTAIARDIHTLDGTIWLACREGLFEINQENDLEIAIHRSPDSSYFYHIAEYQNRLLISSTNNGLELFNPSSRTFQNLLENSLPDIELNYCRELYKFDNELWVSTSDNGVYAIDLDKVFSTSSIMLPPKENGPRSLHYSGGEIVLATSAGTNLKYTGSTQDSWQVIPSLQLPILFYESNQDRKIAVTQNDIWIQNPSNKELQNIWQNPSLEIWDACIRRNSLLLATSDGPRQIRLDGSDMRMDTIQGLKDIQSVVSVHSSENQTIYAYGERYLYLFNDHTRQDTTWDIGSDINDVLFFENSDSIVISGKDGLYIIDSDWKLQKILSEPHQIGEKELYLTHRIDNYLWCLSSNNLGRLDLSTGQFFQTAYPATELPLNPQRIAISHDDQFYLADLRRIIRVDPALLHFDSSQTFVNIYDFYVNDTRYEGEVTANYIDALNLNYQQNTISVDLNAVDSYFGTGSYVKYRLKNYEDEWKYKSSENDDMIVYQNLPPDDYELELLPIRSSGALGHPKTVNIAIAPPYWQTWGFRAGVAGGLVGLGWLISFSITRRKLREQEAELEKQRALSAQRSQLADDLHDELGSELSKILYLSDEAAQIKDEDKKVDLLDTITQAASSSIRNMRDLLWTMDHDQDSLQDLVMRLRQSINDSLAPYPVSATFQVPEVLPDKQLSAEQRHHILLIFKELVHNTIKHADCTQVSMQVQISAKNLVLTYSDDGQGFDPSDTSNGRGRPSMARRAKQIGAVLDIDSAPGNGMVATISLALEEQ